MTDNAENLMWKPIGSAPKDGTEIILANKDRVTTGMWSRYNEITGKIIEEWIIVPCEDYYYEETEKADYFTHWMPMPSAPKEGEAKNGY